MFTANQVNAVDVRCVGNAQPDRFREDRPPSQFDQTVEVTNNRPNRGLISVEFRIMEGSRVMFDSRRAEIIDGGDSKQFTITAGVPRSRQFSAEASYASEVEAVNFADRSFTTPDEPDTDSGGGSSDGSSGGLLDDEIDSSVGNEDDEDDEDDDDTNFEIGTGGGRFTRL